MRFQNSGFNTIAATLFAIIASACTKTGDETAASAAATAGASAQAVPPGMGDMKGMEGMRVSDSAGMKGMSGMSGEMQKHMQSMSGMSGEQMKATLPVHRQMVANMLSQMTGEMQKMKMTADAGWSATMDSVRQDLVRMPAMSPADLNAMMTQHMARVSRLGTMHKEMMGKMQP